jgi:hypothetical protein
MACRESYSTTCRRYSPPSAGKAQAAVRGRKGTRSRKAETIGKCSFLRWASGRMHSRRFLDALEEAERQARTGEVEFSATKLLAPTPACLPAIV